MPDWKRICGMISYEEMEVNLRLALHRGTKANLELWKSASNEKR
jgi:hypothetical protein